MSVKKIFCRAKRSLYHLRRQSRRRRAEYDFLFFFFSFFGFRMSDFLLDSFFKGNGNLFGQKMLLHILQDDELAARIPCHRNGRSVNSKFWDFFKWITRNAVCHNCFSFWLKIIKIPRTHTTCMYNQRVLNPYTGVSVRTKTIEPPVTNCTFLEKNQSYMSFLTFCPLQVML